MGFLWRGTKSPKRGDGEEGSFIELTTGGLSWLNWEDREAGKGLEKGMNAHSRFVA